MNTSLRNVPMDEMIGLNEAMNAFYYIRHSAVFKPPSFNLNGYLCKFTTMQNALEYQQKMSIYFMTHSTIYQSFSFDFELKDHEIHCKTFFTYCDIENVEKYFSRSEYHAESVPKIDWIQGLHKL